MHYYASGMLNIYQGEILIDEVIYANELYVTVASKLPGVTRTTLPNIISCKSEISPDMRYRIEAVFGG